MRDAVLGVLGLGITALLAATVYQNYHRFHKPLITTVYQAVTLENGNVFYGRIDHLGSDHPVLRDAFSIRTEIDVQTSQPRYVLVRRKDEINGADHMIFPITAIAFIEPVAPDSIIGKLIAQANTG
jgi:hypothetical protein